LEGGPTGSETISTILPLEGAVAGPARSGDACGLRRELDQNRPEVKCALPSARPVERCFLLAKPEEPYWFSPDSFAGRSKITDLRYQACSFGAITHRQSQTSDTVAL